MPHVLAVIDDLFFIGKLTGPAKQVGITLQTTTAAQFSLDALRREKPALAIFDLNTTSANALELIRQLKADPDLAAIPVIGFFSHVQVELMRAAEQAGCNEVMPRSKFTATLPDLLRRFAGN